MREKISILGAGSWGTTLAVMLSKKENLEVILWSPFAKQIEEIRKNNENKIFLPSVPIPPQLILTSNLNEALMSNIIMFAIPVEYLRENIRKIKQTKINLKNKIFLSLIKGIEIESLKRPTQIIKEELKIKDAQIAVLSGPTIAKEVALGMPAVATIASKSLVVASKLQNIFKDTPLRIYTHKDVAGIETAGALKNIIAIACGISDGLGLGTNTKSALICRGLKEIIRFAKVFGIKKDVFFGISGIGDLCTTCFSKFSRNRTVGEEIGKGKTLKQTLQNMKMVAEGVNTTKAVYNLAKKYKIDMPITAEVYKILYLNKSPKKAVCDLMSRPLKAE
ncbi:MAG: NAD(P)-dependent glycerol-3-phosphate dehydrogenase [Candidatus Omnitrophica bacterium]|nr:NAD(P)-dependent glycerol-3-phosphate dehydrogenase [Candidatus Omnitrophota bacterium]